MSQSVNNDQVSTGNAVDNTRIFKNEFLELLTYTSFPLHVSFYGGVSVLFYILGVYFTDVPAAKGLLIWALSFIAWSPLEYFLHRFVFHFVNEWGWVKKFHFIVHGVHHNYPHEEKRTMMPPSGGTIFVMVVFPMLYLMFGQKSFFVMGGIILGYLCYSGMHYCIHMFKAPKFLQPLWTHHLLHHYQNDDAAFGVSSRIWDRVFGTMPKKK